MNKQQFPFKNYDNQEILNEFELLKKYINKNTLKNNSIKSHIGQKISNKYFQYERFATPAQNKISGIDYWDLKQKYIIEKYKDRNQHYQNTIQFLNHCPSQFPPSIAGLFYKEYKAQSVFDPYAGWGDRCLASISMNISYIGCDSNTKLKKPYKNMINELKNENTNNVKIYFDKSENILKKIKNKKFDLAFTSPPFFNQKNKLVEEYNNTCIDYDEFLYVSLLPVLKYCFKNCKTICFHLPVNMYDDLLKYFKPADKIIIFTTSSNTKKNLHGLQTKNFIYCWFNTNP